MISDIMAYGVSRETAQEIIDELVTAPRQRGISERKIPAEIYSRVVGYFRPVNQWNPGKQEEFRERVVYRIKGDVMDIENLDFQNKIVKLQKAMAFVEAMNVLATMIGRIWCAPGPPKLYDSIENQTCRALRGWMG